MGSRKCTLRIGIRMTGKFSLNGADRSRINPSPVAVLRSPRPSDLFLSYNYILPIAKPYRISIQKLQCLPTTSLIYS